MNANLARQLQYLNKNAIQKKKNNKIITELLVIISIRTYLPILRNTESCRKQIFRSDWRKLVEQLLNE